MSHAASCHPGPHAHALRVRLAPVGDSVRLHSASSPLLASTTGSRPRSLARHPASVTRCCRSPRTESSCASRATPSAAALLASAPIPRWPVGSSSPPVWPAQSALRSTPRCSVLPVCVVHPALAQRLDTLTTHLPPPLDLPVPSLLQTSYSSL